MILLDINVISEVLRPNPDTKVAHWMQNLARPEVWTCSIVVAELWAGVELLPPGRKQTVLAEAVRAIVDGVFDGQVLNFDLEAARPYAQIRSRRRNIGRPIGEIDAQIAAIAVVHKATLATRNVRDFEHCGLQLVNPWEKA